MAELPLALVGCDFRVASSRWRSRLALGPDEARALRAALWRNEAADGFALLETCNRSEWLVSGKHNRWAAELLRGRMLQRLRAAGAPELCPYVLVGEEAARHIMRVAIGRESLVLGERQIAGQLFRALEDARREGSSSRILNGLSAVCGRLVRRAIGEGLIASSARGVHSLALDFLRERRPRGRVAVVGLGAIGKRVLGLLEADPGYRPVALNRSPHPGARPLTELRATLATADACIVCTGARAPLVQAAHIAPRKAPLLLIDIGIPAQSAAELPGVERADLDTLSAFHQGHDAAAEADEEEVAAALVRRAVADFAAFCREPTFAQLLDALQKRQRELVRERVPALCAGPLEELPEAQRSRLEGDLRRIVLELTGEVFRTVKEATRHRTEGPPCRDAS